MDPFKPRKKRGSTKSQTKENLKLKNMKKLILLTQLIALNLFTASAQFTKLYDFLGNATSGANPQGNLYCDGTFLYGMTVNGGANSEGLIFKMKKDGTSYSDMFDFSNTLTGRYPHGSLISDGTYLYGVTQYGGTMLSGTVFKILPNGTGYVKLYEFDGPVNGKAPFGSLYYDGTFIYGMPQIGGANNFGTIFKINTSNNAYQKLLDFTGVPGVNNSGEPEATLISDGTFLYGMGYNGAANNKGSVFKVKTDGTLFSNILTCTGTVGIANGSYATNALVSDGTYLYGMTESGGLNDKGTIFKINMSTNVYTKLMDFNGANGAVPHAGLIYDGTYLYGAASGGGANNTGLLFKILPTGLGFVDLFDFDPAPSVASGKAPRGDLYSDGCYLYGMTVTGGSNNLGVVFKFQYNASPTITAVSSTSLLCSGQTATLSANGANTYTWNPGGTGANIAVSPTTTTNYTITGTTANSCESSTTIVLPVAVCSGIDQLSAEANDLIIYPNPGNGVFTLKIDGLRNANYELQIFNGLGEKISASMKTDRDSNEIDFSSSPKGIYFVKILHDDKVYLQKIILQ